MKVHTNLLTWKWKHFETMTKELVWILFYFRINTWKNLGYTIFMNRLGKSTLHPPKIVVTNTKKLHWFFWYMWTPQTWGPMVVEKMYVIYFMHIDLFNPLHLTIGWALTFIQKNFEFQNVVMHILKILFLCLKFSKDVIKILAYYIPITLVTHHCFGWNVVKNGSFVMCFHLIIGCEVTFFFLVSRKLHM
jgi:hypothetical protein